MTTTDNTPAPRTAITSVPPTPRIEPNNTASIERFAWPNRFDNARPIANEAVVMTPMAASEPILPRRATRPIMSADSKPHSPAPR